MLAGTDIPQPAAAPRTTATGQANRERILDAALARFARTGLSGTRIDEIAVDAGLSKTNLLYYFRTKNALYIAVLRRTLEMWLEPLRQIDAGHDPRAALAHYVMRKLEAARDFPQASRLFALEIMRGAPMLSGVIAGDLKDLVDTKVALLRRWQIEGRLGIHEPHHLLFHIWAMTQHYADFAVQVEGLTGQTLHDPVFFETTRRAILAAVTGMAFERPQA
ncbi:MAG: TetR family transcriptional regulator C-terminal domain-containing protein [Hyphomicrobiales bacterium]|jgi:TetR/AcrR family transcriptional regulator|nr:TetR family transcriptional regulator C-terminal domain-containing protein [Hyphomicrobiales bacterium]